MTPLKTMLAGTVALFFWAPATLADFVPNDVIVSDPTSDLPDPEFDEIDNHMVWQDIDGNLWLSRIDPATGEVMPNDGRGLLLDTNLRDIEKTGNGPEWASGDGRPYLAYTRDFLNSYVLGAGFTRPDGTWATSLLGNSELRARPEGTPPSHIGPPRIAYNIEDGGDVTVGYRDLSDASSEGIVEGAGLMAQGGRWIEGENRVIVMMQNRTYEFGMVDASQSKPELVQATFGNGNKINAFSWYAPEYDEPMLVAIVIRSGRHNIGIFHRSKDDPDIWEMFNEFEIPSPDYPYISSPEAFVANGKSYVITVAASEVGAGEFKFQPSGPAEIWIAGIDPDEPFFRRVDDPSIPYPDQPRRSEPEMYTTAEGPVVFYSELKKGDRGQNIRLLRRADTGLGPEWGYDFQSYKGPWDSINRDGRNSGSTPFPVADTYEEAGFEAIDNAQSARMVMGPEGNLYMSMLRINSRGVRPQFRAVDTRNGNREVFSLSTPALSSGFFATNGLVTADGNIIMGGDSLVSMFTPDGDVVWSVDVPGVSRGLQFGPDGNVILFTWNGWFQSIDPATGGYSRQNLTRGRSYGNDASSCFGGSDRSGCSYINAPAVDARNNVVYVTRTTETDDSAIEAWGYDTTTKRLTLLGSTSTISGRISSPVLSSDFSKLYVETGSGALMAFNTSDGTASWTAFLTYTTEFPKEPVVNEFGYIMPGGSPDATELTIFRDVGTSFEYAFRDRTLAPLSQAAVGRGNRFVLAARKNGKPELVVLTPYNGIITETPWIQGPTPGQFTGITLREDGWIYLGGGETTTFKAYRPKWPHF